MNTELKVTHQLRGFARRLVAEGLMEEQAALTACEKAAQKDITVLAWLIKEDSMDALAPGRELTVWIDPPPGLKIDRRQP